jgi:hypothetical protein
LKVKYAVVTEVLYKDEQGPYGNYAIKYDALHTPIFGIDVGTAVPSNLNMVGIPKVGEIVKLEKSPTSDTSENNRAQSWKYTQIISTQGQKSNNINGDVTKSEVKSENSGTPTDGNRTVAESTTETDNQQEGDSVIYPLQPYEGDILFEGRHGQSIRFGSTIGEKKDQYPGDAKHIPYQKGGGKHGDSITIIRNGQKTDFSTQPTKQDIYKFINENINHDGSSLYLTSTQEIDLAKPSNNDRAWKNQGLFSDDKFKNAAQAILSSERVVISSKSKESMILSYGGIILSSREAVTIDSGTNIELSAERIGLGVETDNNTEPAVLGNQTQTVLEDIVLLIGDVINIISTMEFQTGTGTSNPGPKPAYQAELLNVKNKLNSLLPSPTRISEAIPEKEKKAATYQPHDATGKIIDIKSKMVFLNKTSPDDNQKDPDWGQNLNSYNKTQ